MTYAPHANFKSLYDAYTGPDSTGQHLTKHMVRLTERDPILIVTGADFVIFPGYGKDPIVESFRNSTRGFVELTAISHIGAAIAWIFRLKELGYPTWRDDANRLVADGWAVEGFASAGGSLYAAEGSGFVCAIDRATVRSFSSLSEPWPKRTRR